MNRIMELQRKLVPEAMDLLERRFVILRLISREEPLGRRTLAQRTGLTERVVRAETDFLKSRDFIDILPRGMIMTPAGTEILQAFQEILKEFLGLEELAEVLRQRYHFKKVIVVPGNSDTNPEALEEIGRKASAMLVRLLKHTEVVALTGGNTIKTMVEQFPAGELFPGVTVVPARGGVGRHYDIQSNTLVGRLADKIQGSYRLLNLPDNLSEASFAAMLQEKEVRETIAIIRQADVVVAGVGDALNMAQRRGLTRQETAQLVAAGARGEFFGSYYNGQGEIVKQNLAVGLSLEDVRRAKEIIVLAGGASKGRAIASVRFDQLSAVLITDEGAAREMIDMSRDMTIDQPERKEKS